MNVGDPIRVYVNGQYESRAATQEDVDKQEAALRELSDSAEYQMQTRIQELEKEIEALKSATDGGTA